MRFVINIFLRNLNKQEILIMKEFELIKEFIIKNGQLKSFKTGQIIISPDKEIDKLFLLGEGEARLIFRDNNKRTTLKKFFQETLLDYPFC